MKAYSSLVALVFVAMAGIAHADQISLNDIDTNDCTRAQKEVLLLNKASAGITVSAVCSEYSPGGYASDNGRKYDYRLYTTVAVSGALTHGTTLQFGDIDTNNCNYAQEEVSLLNSRTVTVQASCSDYVPGGYTSDNGQTYNYRVYSTMTVN